MNVLDLFSGIGGFSLGLERAGLSTVAFCEIDGGCRAVLRKHWPDVPIFNDIRNLIYEKLRFYGISDVDVVSGGFPCQDVSCANVSGAGLSGERSGLWSEFFRLIAEIRPRYAIIENVPVLRKRGLCRILADLASIRYDAEWHVIPAAAVGRPHLRERIWVVAYPPRDGGRQERTLLDENDFEVHRAMAHREAEEARGRHESLYSTIIPERPLRKIPERVLLANGFSSGVGEQIKQYGNAVVPAIPEIIGRAILGNEARLKLFD